MIKFRQCSECIGATTFWIMHNRVDVIVCDRVIVVVLFTGLIVLSVYMLMSEPKNMAEFMSDNSKKLSEPSTHQSPLKSYLPF